jgi:hypothetical protein
MNELPENIVRQYYSGNKHTVVYTRHDGTHEIRTYETRTQAWEDVHESAKNKIEMEYFFGDVSDTTIKTLEEAVKRMNAAGPKMPVIAKRNWFSQLISKLEKLIA